jgi:hypothetical protein
MRPRLRVLEGADYSADSAVGGLHDVVTGGCHFLGVRQAEAPGESAVLWCVLMISPRLKTKAPNLSCAQLMAAESTAWP